MFFSRIASLFLAAAAPFKQVEPKKQKKQKKYPTMVASSQQDIDAWNEAVKAGLITRKGNIRKAALHA